MTPELYAKIFSEYRIFDNEGNITNRACQAFIILLYLFGEDYTRERKKEIKERRKRIVEKFASNYTETFKQLVIEQ